MNAFITRDERRAVAPSHSQRRRRLTPRTAAPTAASTNAQRSGDDDGRIQSSETEQPACDDVTLAQVPPAVHEKPVLHSLLLAHTTRHVPARGSQANGAQLWVAPLAARETDALSQVSVRNLHALSRHMAGAAQSVSAAHVVLQPPSALHANGAQSEPQQIAWVHSCEAHSEPRPHA